MWIKEGMIFFIRYLFVNDILILIGFVGLDEGWYLCMVINVVGFF